MKVLHNITIFLILLCCSVQPSSAECMKYKDPKVPLKACIADLLSRMTLAEKIGQMTQIGRLNATSDVLRNYFICMDCSISYENLITIVLRFYTISRKFVAACAKHYSEVSTHMAPYYNAIVKGVSTVMVSYSSWNGEKMHANHFLVADFLKNKLNFRGFVISDWQGIDKITSPMGANYSYSIQQASITAGLDMVMIPYNYFDFINILTNFVKAGVIPMSRIDDAVRRILRDKFIMGAP
ncbi:hypothetical protein LUZ63_006053 [Rhynchospora breviuscula]|uniref:beta-glucosidase n=1 Tax=Rhynchospora breviuscula TaxID=2022672 RepID=A0A9Q0HT79_9POAL|nr:hypothetical protein LUZ63_006053 [Rhynchospora breviuscula]